MGSTETPADSGTDLLAGQVNRPTVDLPDGYTYGVTRYADVVLASAFPQRFEDLVFALETFSPTLDELRASGGNRTSFVARFDESLATRFVEGQRVWGKQNVTISKEVALGGQVEMTSRVRGHEIDIFGVGTLDAPLPGIAVEMEWNNKDPFFDRDLVNFQALHRDGAIAVGVIVTRGPRLQELIKPLITSKDNNLKYGESSTHWNKLVPRVNLGGGGECPLLLIGIEPERIAGIEAATEAMSLMRRAEMLRTDWRSFQARGEVRDYAHATQVASELRRQARALVPPAPTHRDS